jgi:hypothetical protein
MAALASRHVLAPTIEAGAVPMQELWRRLPPDGHLPIARRKLAAGPDEVQRSARLTHYVAAMTAGNLRRTLAVVALVATVSACSGGGDAGAAQDGGNGDESDDGGVVDYSLDYDGEDSIVPGSAELEEALLTADDLPEGLVDLGLHYSAVEICGMRTELPDNGDQFPTGAAAFALENDPIVPAVFEKIVVTPRGSGAGVFQRVRETLATNCNSGGQVDGLVFLNASDLAIPTLGDETVAKRVTIRQLPGQTTVGINILYARSGDMIVAVGVVEPDGATDSLVELARLAFDRATAT